jgi:hypothetical protein
MALIDQLLAGVISDDQKILIQMIIHESVVAHVDPVLAVSMAMLESALNPQAIGDNGTSFGLFQLHKGGELGDMTAEAAFDPVKNTRVALGYLKQFEKPEFNPGQLAAAAQRPRYPEIYSYTVNVMYPLVKSLMENLGVYDGNS